MTERTYWEKLKRIGWLEYVPENRRAELRARIKKALASDAELVHLCLLQAGFDAECIYEPGDYCELLRSLAEDSQQVFRPTHLKEEDVVLSKRRYGIRVSFRQDGKKFSVTVPHDSDWFEMRVLDLVNEALEASGTKQRFIVLPIDSQLIFLALIPPAIYERAVAEQLIPPSPKEAWQELAEDPGWKREAIKAYREQHGGGQADAKQAVENYIQQQAGEG